MDIKVNILNENVKIPKEIVDAAMQDELVARIFFNRGYQDAETIREMLGEGIYVPTQSSEFPFMKQAVDRVAKAIEASEKIAVYGDYDVDGVTSTALLVGCLSSFSANVIYHVPDRFAEGYGMNEETIRIFSEKGVSLIITCDCGISNLNEIALAESLGVDVIITDHHNIPDQLPNAFAILNPKLLHLGHKARNLSGCGMAYFLAVAIFEHYNEINKADDYLDLLAMSLIADVVSLNGENRYLLKRALPMLFSSDRTGIRQLFKIIEQNSKLRSEDDVAFQIAPRINAAGRMDSARLPVDLLLSTDEELSRQMAQKIDFLNSERKRVQQIVIEQAIELVENRKKNKTVLVLYNEYWHHGILGIAASKVCETYKKPAILLSLKEDGETIVGSARSIEEIDIYELIKACSGKLIKFGGHTQAAGLSLKKKDLEAFTSEIERAAEESFYIREEMKVDVDKIMQLNEIDESFYNRILNAGPYGEGFDTPIFLSQGITVVSDRKTEKNHHIMILTEESGVRIPAVKWFGDEDSYQDKTFDIIYRVGINSYRGKSELQLTIDYFIASAKKTKKPINVNFIEGRNEEIAEILLKYNDLQVFYEGLISDCTVSNKDDRYGVKNAKNLIFLSTPVNASIFREVISLVNPQNVIINFSQSPDYSFAEFIKNIFGVIKYLIINDEEKADIEQLSMKMCAEESLLRSAFKYLQALGKIIFSNNTENGEISFAKGDGVIDKNLPIYEKNLKDALIEKNAYQQFIRNMGIEKFHEYLK